MLRFLADLFFFFWFVDRGVGVTGNGGDEEEALPVL